jgi:DNA-binding transcriptional ArsR family regulator
MSKIRDIDSIRLSGEADFGTPARLVGHPARAAILLALLDGRALPMSRLAAEAGVAPSTASEHLKLLADAGLLTTRREGRNRYYELASPQVAEALEALARLVPPREVRSLRGARRSDALRLARSCYDHAAGRLGVALMRALLDSGALVGGDGLHHPEKARGDRLSAPGRDLDYRLTEAGWALFDRLGAEVPSGRRRTVAYCVDWTEQRHHLAGAAGAALLARLIELGWLRRNDVPRALTITDEGARGLAEVFGIDVPRAA